MADRVLKAGVVGLGVGAALMVRELEAAPNFELYAAADIDPAARERFRTEFPAVNLYDGIEGVAADPDVEVVWLSTPNRLHPEHTVLLAEAGKHVMVQKPMALTLAEAETMVEAADRSHVKLLAGHSKAYTSPVQMMRQIVRSGELGALCAVNAFASNAWLMNTRKQEDLDPAEGGGILYRNAPHQIDSIRLIGDGLLRSVRGTFGQWMPERPSPGYYSAYMEFEDGTPAVAIQNSYGYFAADELTPWASSMEKYGRSAAKRGATRRAIRSGTANEMAQYQEMTIGGSADYGTNFGASLSGAREWATDLGIVIVSCERGDIRHSADGVYVYDDHGVRDIALPLRSYGEAQLRELYGAVALGYEAYQSGRWGMATLEVALAITESARTGREVLLRHQVALGADYDEDHQLSPEDVRALT